jgi:CheY-like chemotaxis protein
MARVLVVDDDPAGLEIRKLMLERRGHQVTVARDVLEARAALQVADPETVIMDLRLPEPEDGLALIRDFRAAAPGMRIVVLCGCSADLDDRPEAGLVNQILSKPVRSERLLEAIAGAVSGAA